MADDRHYVPGDFYRICDRTGFKIRAKRTRKEWTGRIVRDQSWEPRQPQDFVRGRVDYQRVPDPRSRQPNRFITVIAPSYEPASLPPWQPQAGPAVNLVTEGSDPLGNLTTAGQPQGPDDE